MSFWVAFLPAHGQRLTRERIFATPSKYSTTVTSITLGREGNLCIALNHGITPGSGQSVTGGYQLLAPQLDTLWTIFKLLPGLGRNFLCTLPSGEFVGSASIANTTPSGRGQSFEKFTSSGRLYWSRPAFIHPAQEAFVGTIATADNGWLGVILATQITGLVRQQCILFKTDSAGQVRWQRPYGWSLAEDVLHIQRNPATGRILLAGNIQPVGATNGADKEYKLLLVNERGDSIRGRRLAPLGAGVNVRTQQGWEKLLPLRDGGWLLTGVRDSATTTNDPPLLVRLDSLLHPRWTALRRPPAGQQLRYADACELTDGSLLVLAWQVFPATNSFALHRYSATGQLLAVLPLVSACPQVHPARLTPTLDGRGVFIAGSCDQSPTDRRGYVALVDLQSLPGAVVLSAPQPTQPATTAPLTFELFPNPASTTATVRYQLPAGTTAAALHLYDATGRLARRLTLRGGSGGAEVTVPLAGLAPGLYAATLLAADGRPLATRRLAVAAP
ncbi:T9SS type A sorting domain-containing protein [Hymenobacter sediminicola]|uniref:T9SS type A sorting domain-containing protein n=1 Tax=Hymenobacter sediminicola TaxID=2761579 RepID=A0A7G7W4S9_9BACT|nr:T9SS type A sorting domain-containing protein [Hymenobacter sediminicola]QNH61372.1 hypothetical protein H4317_14550 [Hymenobacter sediminicola]